MNAYRKYSSLLEEAADKILVQTGHQVHFTQRPQSEPAYPQIDAIAAIHHGKNRQRFVVKVKPHLSRQNLEIAVGHVMELARLTGLLPLLVTNYVNPSIAKTLRARGINYLDAAGNAHLRAGDMFVDIQGQRRPDSTGQPRGLGPKPLQLVALLLAHPEYVNRTARDLAEAAGVALGSVPKTLAELQRRGFIGATGPKERELRDVDGLLDLWVRGYAESKRRSLFKGRYRLARGIEPTQLAEALASATKKLILIGGEAAAAVYTDYLRPVGATLHLMDAKAKLPPELLLPDTGGNIEVLMGFGTAEHWNGPVPGYIHPLLVYGELLALGASDRRIVETAHMLREKFELGGVESTHAT